MDIGPLLLRVIWSFRMTPQVWGSTSYRLNVSKPYMGPVYGDTADDINPALPEGT